MKSFYEGEIKSRSAEKEFMQDVVNMLPEVAKEIQLIKRQTDGRHDQLKYEIFLKYTGQLPKEIILAYGKSNFRKQKY